MHTGGNKESEPNPSKKNLMCATDIYVRERKDNHRRFNRIQKSLGTERVPVPYWIRQELEEHFYPLIDKTFNNNMKKRIKTKKN